MCSGKSESLVVSDAFSQSRDEIDAMIREAEAFAAEDAAHKRRIEALHQLSTFVWQLKAQISDPEGLGGKLSTDEKATIRAELKNADDWIEEFGQSASAEEIQDRLAGVQAVVNPITTALYQSGMHDSDSRSEDEEPYRHVEL